MIEDEFVFRIHVFHLNAERNIVCLWFSLAFQLFSFCVILYCVMLAFTSMFLLLEVVFSTVGLEFADLEVCRWLNPLVPSGPLGWRTTKLKKKSGIFYKLCDILCDRIHENPPYESPYATISCCEYVLWQMCINQPHFYVIYQL